MPSTFTPFVEGESSPDPARADAYVPVRVPDGQQRNGYLLVYLPDGTGLEVDGRHLLRLDRDQRGPGALSLGQTITGVDAIKP